jgi:hypothetical protein
MDKPTIETDITETQEFKDFQRGNYCGHVSYDDLERWYFRADKEREALQAELAQVKEERDVLLKKLAAAGEEYDEMFARLALAEPLLRAAMVLDTYGYQTEEERQINILTAAARYRKDAEGAKEGKD